MIEAKAKLWLERDGNIILGRGRAQLLEEIKKTGSIVEAARSMNMSYSHAWSEVRKMSDALGEPVIETTRGGKKGGSSKLTPAGIKLLKRFQEEVERLDRHLAHREH
jgi:molybdate transport repressor ModE-like protein